MAADHRYHSVGRAPVVDGDTVPLSVLPTAEIPHIGVESGFRSTGTGFAVILAGLIGEQSGRELPDGVA